MLVRRFAKVPRCIVSSISLSIWRYCVRLVGADDCAATGFINVKQAGDHLPQKKIMTLELGYHPPHMVMRFLQISICVQTRPKKLFVARNKPQFSSTNGFGHISRHSVLLLVTQSERRARYLRRKKASHRS